MQRTLTSVLGFGVLALGVSTACSGANDGDNKVGQGGAGGSAASASGGTGNIVDIDSGGGSGGDPFKGCARDNYTGELLPLDMYVMLDRSGSMQDDDKWGLVTGALNQFLGLPGLTQLGMGLGLFPLQPSQPPMLPQTCANNAQCGVYGPCMGGFGCAGAPLGIVGGSCVASDYVSPIVPIAPLPGVASQIQSAISNTGPNGSITPTAMALEGAIDYAQTWAAQHTDHVTVVVLATDGQPSGCDPNRVDTVAQRAEEGFLQNPSVKTFVIGIGNLSVLNTIAQKGGTDQALIVNTGSNAGQEFLDALNKIRGAVGCSYKIPTPQSGMADFNKLNVVFTQDGVVGPEVFPNVGSAAGCQGNQGWYYDNPNSPSQILLCPASCDRVQSIKGSVDVVLGCATVVG